MVPAGPGRRAGMSSSVDQFAVSLPDGVRMPLLGFGTWQATGSQGYDAVRQALEVGYRHVDTATMYRNETEVGRAVRDSGVPREDVFVTTKLLPDEAGREREAIGQSLAALGTEYVDLWLIHWPPDRSAGVDTWREFIAVRDRGLARAIGVSNYDTGQLDELIAATGEAPAVNQIPWSPSLHDPARLAENRARGVVVEGYSPFKRTDLKDATLARIAAAHGVSVPRVVLRWHLQREIVVIPKSVTPDRIAANFDVFGFSLTDDELREIDGLGH